MSGNKGGRPIPPALKALRAALWRARSDALRLEWLYGRPAKPVMAKDLDLRRRERFVRERHPIQ